MPNTPCQTCLLYVCSKHPYQNQFIVSISVKSVAEKLVQKTQKQSLIINNMANDFGTCLRNGVHWQALGPYGVAQKYFLKQRVVDQELTANTFLTVQVRTVADILHHYSHTTLEIKVFTKTDFVTMEIGPTNITLLAITSA